MNKPTYEFSHCFIGNGYASRIGSYLLSHKNVESVIISNEIIKPIMLLELENSLITPLPIFPVKDSELTKKLFHKGYIKFEALKVKYGINKNVDFSRIPKPKSLAEFLYSNERTKAWVNSSLKQWGESIFENSFHEVQKKIKRQYLETSKNGRIGFVNGQTLYNKIINKTDDGKILSYSSILKIDLDRKIIYTDKFNLKYKKLISTIPIDNFFKLLNYKIRLNLKYEGAFFIYFKYSGDFGSNSMIYDSDLESDIFRIFAISSKYLMVQIPFSKRNSIDIEKIKRRIYVLDNGIQELEFLKQVKIERCYPIDMDRSMKFKELKDKMRDNGIVCFGRFGNWEYKDLHELNWDEIF